MTTDVLIAGAGPAGSIAALVLARAGVRVCVLDRAAFPRDKLCGDTLNPGALAILQRLGIAAGVERAGLPIRGMVVTGLGGARICGEYGPGVHGIALRRRDLDSLLLQAAADAGAVVETGVLVQDALVAEAAGRRRVTGVKVLTSGNSIRRLDARVVIAADGRRSRLAFQMGLARHPAHPRRWAVGGYFDDVATLPGLGEMHVRPGRYVGVAAVPGGLTNACVVVSEPRGGSLAEPAALLVATLRRDPALAERFADARLAGAPRVIGPLAVDPLGAGVDGLLLAGDAAGFVDPMTGDGLRFAFRGAELAAEVAVAVLSGALTDAPAQLARRRRAEFGRKLRMNRALRSIVASPLAITWAERGARLFPPALRQVISIAGDVP